MKINILLYSFICFTFLSLLMTIESHCANNDQKFLSIINNTFAEQLFIDTYPSYEIRCRTMLKNLDSLNKGQLKKLKKIIQDAIDADIVPYTDRTGINENKNSNKNGSLKFNSAFEMRFAGWVRNVINDKLDILPYDFIVEGAIGRLTSATTVSYYNFTSNSDKHLEIIIGQGTLEEDNGKAVFGYDWAYFPRFVRLFLTCEDISAHKVYYVKKIVALKKKIRTKKNFKMQ